MTRPLHTSVARREHAYTRSEVPWRIEFDPEPDGPQVSPRRRFGWRLLRYLAGGGIKSLGRTAAQEERLLRRRRFFAAMGAAGALWLALWLF